MKILPLQDLFSNIRQKSTITNRNFWKVDTTHSGNLATSFSESGIMKVDQIFSGVDAFEKSELEAFCSAAFLINI